MRIVTYRYKKVSDLGLLINESIYSLNSIANNMNDFLHMGGIAMKKARDLEEKIIKDNSTMKGIALSETKLLAPIPNPASFRDAYAFKQHVATARENRGVKMIPEFDQFPVFYFSNHNAITGPTDDIVCMPDHMEKLDFELELAIVIGKRGKNILSKDADNYIAGFCILNDLSARRLQMEEMKLNLGPSKGKDFGNILGPYLITPDELESKCINTSNGKKYDLNMKCFVNGELLSEGNAKDMSWTFAEIIERASYGVELTPGDVIGSGTVGTGCLLELNGTAKKNNPNYTEKWLMEGDEIEMRIEKLGVIRNKIVKSNSDHSILKLKK